MSLGLKVKFAKQIPDPTIIDSDVFKALPITLETLTHKRFII